MTITEHKKQDGTIVYRRKVYLGIDSVTGKQVKTTVSARTKKEVRLKAKQAENQFRQSGSTRHQGGTVATYRELAELW